MNPQPPSITRTLMIISFTVVTIAYVLSIVEKIGVLSIRPFDSTACITYMTPLLSLYFGRRWTDMKSTVTDTKSVTETK